MKRLTYLLLTAATVSLAACDYNKTPGKDPQASQDFTNAPGATTNETDRDSITPEQRVESPVGTGSATDQQSSDSAALNNGNNDPNSPVGNMPTASPEAQSTTRKQ